MAYTSFLTKVAKIFFGLFLLIIVICIQSCVYSKPTYSGRVIDAEEGKPLKGVRVEAEYWLSHQTLVEQNSRSISRYQVFTDENGYFEIPSYTTIISPFSWDNMVVFSFKKNGYARIININIANCLSVGCEKKIYDYVDDNSKKITISTKLLELPKL